MVQQRIEARSVVERLGIRAHQYNAYEADDIIATLALLARSAGQAVTVVSADRDLEQVLRPGDEFWNLSAGQRRSYSAVRRRLRISPEQLPELLALRGDTADNVPGVPGINTGLARRLVRKWGGIEALYAALDSADNTGTMVEPTLADSLLDHREQVYLARSLTSLEKVPLGSEAITAVTADIGDIKEECDRLRLPANTQGALVERSLRSQR